MHAAQAYAGPELQLHPFLTWPMHDVSLLASRAYSFILMERAPAPIHYVWVDRRPACRKLSRLFRELNHDSWVVQSLVWSL